VKTNTYRKQFLQIFDSIDFDSIVDHPNILIAASFWDNDRYCAAKTCYRFMRKIDDLIDNHKAANMRIAPEERTAFLTDVGQWLQMVVVSDDCNPEKEALIKTVERFRIPLWTLESFARSMIYDINNEGFRTLEAFIEYSQGASVAPASIFVHLSGLKQAGDGYTEPEFDVREAATPCAIFSYLVHIIRDFQKDQLNNLNYFADDLVAKNGLSRQDLNDIAHGSQVTAGFRNLIREYRAIADKYRRETIEIMKRIGPLMEPSYRLSLEIIFSLYLMVFERIDPDNGSFSSAELNPSPSETTERVFETIMNFNID
jgi:phytoene/squalene synthetase